MLEKREITHMSYSRFFNDFVGVRRVSELLNQAQDNSPNGGFIRLVSALKILHLHWSYHA